MSGLNSSYMWLAYMCVAPLVACSDPADEPNQVSPPSQTSRTNEPSEAETDENEEAEASEQVADETNAAGATSDPEVEAESAAGPAGRSPASRILPELDSVRWGPDRRPPFESLDDIDALLTARLGRTVRVATRMRARHGRDRITLAVALALKAEGIGDAEPETLASVLKFNGDPITDPALSADRREGDAGELGDPCRCMAEAYVDLLLIRIVHEETVRVDVLDLPAEVCSGDDAQLRLADFDRDGRVELRADIRYYTDTSCGARSESYTRLYIVDIADLVLQSNVVAQHHRGEYFGDSDFNARTRFTALNEDDYPDIEVVGVLVSSGEQEGDSRTRIQQSWLYDVATDSWVRQISE